MKIIAQVRCFSVAIFLFVLAGCSSGSDNDGDVPPVLPANLLAIAGLWDATSISSPSSSTVFVQSGSLYANFTDVSLSGFLFSFYSKDRTNNCLNGFGPYRMRPSGGNRLTATDGSVFNFILDNRVDNTDDVLEISLPFGSDDVTKHSRATGISSSDLQLCSRSASNRSSNTAADNAAAAVSNAIRQ